MNSSRKASVYVKLKVAVLFGAGTLIISPHAARASANTWTGPSLTSWSVATNWSAGSVPTFSSAVVLTGAIASITNGTTAEAASLLMNGDARNTEVLLTNSTLTVAGAGVIGGDGSGTTGNQLTVFGSSVVSFADLTLASGTQAGRVQLNGTSTLTVSNGIANGLGAGTAGLTIRNGTPTLNSPSVSLDNLAIGVEATTNASFSINAGQTYTAAAIASVGFNGNFTNTLTLDGGSLTAAEVRLGNGTTNQFGSGNIIVNSGSLAVTAMRVSAYDTTAGTFTLTVNGGTVAGTLLEFGLVTSTNVTAKGVLNVNGGTLTYSNIIMNRFNGTGASEINMGGGRMEATQIYRNWATGAQTFNWNDGTIANIAGGNLDLYGSTNSTENLVIALAGTGTHTFDVGSGRTATVQATAVLADQSGQNGTLNKAGAGNLLIQSASTYTGGTTISAGQLTLSNAGALSAATGLDLAGATARFDIAGITAAGSTNGSLAGVSGSVVNLGAKNLDVGGNNASTTFAGTITNTGSLTKSGTGTLTLSGNNTYTGGTMISGGTLLFTNGGSVAGPITNNASLAYRRTDSASVTNAISGTGALTKAGTGTVTLSGANTYSGATTVAGGTLRIDGNARLGNTNTTITISNAGVLEVTAAGTLTNAITAGAGNGVLFNSSTAGALVIAGHVVKDGTVFTSRSGSGTNVFTGVISGASANSDFVVDGGTTVFSNAMTYNGPTIVINGGTLNLGTNNAIPSDSALRLGTNDTAGTVHLQGNNQTVASLETQGTAGTNNLVTLGGGTLTISGGASTTYGGAITGDGTVAKSGAGTLTLSGAVTATNLRISGGAVALGADNVLGGSLNLDLNGGTFIVGSNGTRYTDSLGTLTLSADSVIDMGSTGGPGTITFADSSGIEWATNAVLTITNWQGVANQTSAVTKLLFGTDGLTSGQLAQIRFADQNIDGGQLLGGSGELAPIPEAPVVWGAAALAAFIFWRERRRISLLLAPGRSAQAISKPLTMGSDQARPSLPDSPPTEPFARA
jgi:fibronectin-binding autotransporter adhesin